MNHPYGVNTWDSVPTIDEVNRSATSGFFCKGIGMFRDRSATSGGIQSWTRAHSAPWCEKWESRHSTASPERSNDNQSIKQGPYLLRNLPITHLNQLWVMNITYIQMARDLLNWQLPWTSTLDESRLIEYGCFDIPKELVGRGRRYIRIIRNYCTIQSNLFLAFPAGRSQLFGIAQYWYMLYWGLRINNRIIHCNT